MDDSQGQSDSICNDDSKSSYKGSVLKDGIWIGLGIARLVLDEIVGYIVEKSGINWVLNHFGLGLKQVASGSNVGEKRKRMNEGFLDDSMIGEDLDPSVEVEVKRWRPDGVYEAVNEFMKKMWGEVDKNENLKQVVEGDENSNIPVSPNVTSGKWKIRPEINFVGDESRISSSEVLGTVKDDALKLGGKEVVADMGDVSTPIDGNNPPCLFVFSGDKSKSVIESPLGDQSMFSKMTFAEKQDYFAKQIQEQEEAVSSGRRSPMPI